jgi:WD40 repeat protein
MSLCINPHCQNPENSDTLLRTIKVWDLNTDKEVYTLSEDLDGVFAIVINPSGQTFVSGSDNRKIKVWDLTSGDEICTLTGHFDQVNALTFSSDKFTLWQQGNELYNVLSI